MDQGYPSYDTNPHRHYHQPSYQHQQSYHYDYAHPYHNQADARYNRASQGSSSSGYSVPGYPTGREISAGLRSPPIGAEMPLPSPRPPKSPQFVQQGSFQPFPVGVLPVPIQPHKNPIAAPETVGNGSRSGSVSEPYNDRNASVSTDMSSSASDGQEKEAKKKRSSKLSGKLKSKVKDLFTRDEKDEPVTAIKRESNPWDDEDY